MDFKILQIDMGYMVFLDVVYIVIFIGVIVFVYYKIFKIIKGYNCDVIIMR